MSTRRPGACDPQPRPAPSRVHFDPPLTRARFLRRYKRFFADVELEDGTTVVTHCPNTGSLRGCLVEGAPVLIKRAENPARKLAWTWVAIELDGVWVGVDTSRAEALVVDSLRAGVVPELSGYERVIQQVPYGRSGRSRVDIVLSRGGHANARVKKPRRGEAFVDDERVYVEVKNTTLIYDVRAGEEVSRRAAFPDAVTERGRKHLLELLDVVEKGQRAAIVFSVQRSDCEAFVPADAIDPAWSETLRTVVDQGVEAYALCGAMSPQGIALDRRLEVVLS
ncbi:MAG: DNA/RNA nuclease SfsA [Myxococcales bacterium]|nr:DNA/RNA nuclease SfsA [Myxococcales bacterium]